MNRIRELLSLRSFRHKLMAASVVCILVPGFITLLLYNSLTQEAVKRQALSNAEDSLQLVQGSVTNLMRSMLNIANYIQVNAETTAYLKLLNAGNEDNSSAYAQYSNKKHILEQLDSLTVLGEKSYVTILLPNGKYFINYSVDEFNPLSLREKPWFPELQKLGGLDSYWSAAEPTAFRQDKRFHSHQISVGRTLRLDNDHSDIYAYIVVTFFEDEVSSIFEGLTGEQHVMLLDGEGRIVSDSDKEMIGEPAAENMIGLGESAVREIGGEKVLVVRRSIGLNDWSIVLEQPYKEAIVNISSIFNRVFVFQIASFISFLALLLLLVRTFTKPLVRLGKVATAVQRGNLNVRSGIRGSDEIARLGFLFDQMLGRVQEMIAEVSETQARKRKAELRMLQAQIHPHFLFNVLNSIRMKVMHRGDPESAKMIGSLSRLLRMTISKEEDEITLHEEMDLLTSYVELMNLRQKEGAALKIEADSEVFLWKVPRFFLQPIVENAIIHGLQRRAGSIFIRAELRRFFLVLSVEDDGNGMDADTLEALRRKLQQAPPFAEGKDEERGSFSQFGLSNVAERMRIVFGDGFRMEAESEQGKGTVIRMFIPRKEDGGDVQSDAG
ncbi:histidine kinase [Cohnella lubricantis]|uniref:Histidine kinase n=1 Tax=Cohnella lubricantis TaxID=2163172 RepID=A0A841TJE5_9BACL|nr:histidine kinase [Cohnella lubricantis]MBB6679047.1 histidine kinase [Cohnella lubricantis]MBP2120252.1 two-component system sensor histidine kinase YesM [Cohnella lubricantis]